MIVAMSVAWNLLEVPLKWHLLFATLIVAQASLGALQQRVESDETKNDRGRFSNLTPDDRIKVLLTALDAREVHFANFSYKVREHHENVRLSDGARRFMYRYEYELRHLGETEWMHLVLHNPGQAEGENVIASDTYLNWSGKVGRILNLPIEGMSKETRGSIQVKPTDHFAIRFYNDLLGFKVDMTEGLGVRAPPLAEFLRWSIANNREIEIVDETYKGVDAVRVTVHANKYYRRKFWFDPAKDYMILRLERSSDGANGRYNRSWKETKTARNIDGLWVPWEAIERQASSAWHEETEITYNVEAFTVGTVKENDVAVEFPIGSRVMDLVTRTSYIVEANSGLRVQPFADSSERTVYLPKVKDAVVNPSALETSKLYNKQTMVVPIGAPKPVGRFARLLRIAVVLLGAGVLIGVLRQWRRRTAAAVDRNV